MPNKTVPVPDLRRAVAQAAQDTLRDYSGGLLVEEPIITTDLTKGIRDQARAIRRPGIRVTVDARPMGSIGAGSEESETGADLISVFSVDLPGLRVRKGFLAQSKRVLSGTSPNWKVLRRQCRKMLSFTPDSFVFLYFHDRIEVVPAISVRHSRVHGFGHLHSLDIAEFYAQHFSCFIGDKRLWAADERAVGDLIETHRAMNLLWVRIEESRHAQEAD